VLRHRLGWRQVDVGLAAGLTQDDISNGERGRQRDTGKLRRHAAALDADVVISIRWRGGEIDRLLDEGHATIVGWVMGALVDLGWEVAAEVSFALRGERGSIDVLAWHPKARVLLVIEVKTELTSVEETLRRHDAKQRLAAHLATERFGWRDPSAVCRMLVLPDRSTPRRHVARHDSVLGQTYRLRAGAARAWLNSPAGSASLLVFAPVTRGVRSRRHCVSRKRVRRSESSVAAA
jgi:hypothetical protein